MEESISLENDLTLLLKPQTTKMLNNLFNLDQLQEELRNLEASAAFESSHSKSVDINKIVVDLVDDNMRTAAINDCMDSAPLTADGQHINFNDTFARIALGQVMGAALSIPLIAEQSYKLDVVQRCLRSTACRAALALFRWHCKFGPDLAYTLMTLHRDGGPQAVQSSFPTFAKLVDHIVRHCWHARNRQPKPKKLPAPQSACSLVVWPTDQWGSAEENIPQTSAPWDMYGLRKGSSSKLLKLPDIVATNGKTVSQTDDALYEAAERCLLAYTSGFPIMPP